jgi:formamidopyrimidine-DNA glycosylase
MPELPEITNLARQMNAHLPGKIIQAIDVIQPKSLNIPAADFTAALTGAQITGAHNRGKWIFTATTRGWLLLNLGMGGELLLLAPDALPAKRRLVFYFSDSTCLSVNFWWFGYAHYVPEGALESHAMSAKLGPNALDLSVEGLKERMKGKRGGLKAFLLDQENLAGIGNAYIHDILFLARLHPLRRLESLTNAEVEALQRGIRGGLQPSLDKGGAFYEVDLFGKKGGFLMEDILLGYREGQPCPNCATPIEKLKTGGTSSFLCPQCQEKK